MILATSPAQHDANGKLVRYGYRVTASNGTKEQNERFHAWADKIEDKARAEAAKGVAK